MEVAADSEDLFQWNMPGMMSAADVEAKVDLDKMRIHISKGMTVHTEVSTVGSDHTDKTLMQYRTSSRGKAAISKTQAQSKELLADMQQ